MANKRIIELNERTVINMGDYLMVDDATGSRKLAMSTLFNYLTYSSLMFVDTLPTTDIDPTVIYLVPHSGSTTQWDEYIYRDNQWILIGTSTLDLSSIYQSKTDNSLQTTSKQVVGAINEINSDLSDKLGTTWTELFHSSTNMSWVQQTVASLTNYNFIAIACGETYEIENISILPISVFKTKCRSAPTALCSGTIINNSRILAGAFYVNDTTLSVGIINSNCYIWGIK